MLIPKWYEKLIVNTKNGQMKPCADEDQRTRLKTYFLSSKLSLYHKNTKFKSCFHKSLIFLIKESSFKLNLICSNLG